MSSDASTIVSAAPETHERSTEVELNARCHAWAFSPHVLDLYGDAEAILAHVDRAQMDLTERRMFLLAVENDERAEVKVFEQVSGDTWSVSTWRGDELGGLRGALGDTILANKGVFCVGEQTKGVLGQLDIEAVPDGTVPAPHSARAAFAHPIRDHARGGYARATIALLC